MKNNNLIYNFKFIDIINLWEKVDYFILIFMNALYAVFTILFINQIKKMFKSLY